MSNNGIELVARRPELVPRFVRKRSTEYDMYDKEITRLQAINSSGLTEEEKSLFCRLVAWDPADNQYVLVLEYCEGGDLEGLLQQQPSEVDLPLATVLRWAESLALALDVMHRKLGRLHLDLKPANLLLPSANPSAAEIKVADFGISQVCPMSHDGHWEGTVSAEYPMLEHAFSAPEQGSECGVSPATDRYQLGLVLLQLLCRRRLEDMGDMQALLQCRPNLVYDINRRGFGNCEFKKLPADLQARWKPIGTVEAKAEMDKLPHRGGPLAQLVLDLLRTEPKDRPSEIIKRIKAAK